MARRRRTNNTNHRGRSFAFHGQPHQSRNMFADLAHGGEDDEEVNAHLTERLGCASLSRDESRTEFSDEVPFSESSHTNNDIREYYELLDKPVVGGPWLDRPEIPSPSEILPTDKPGFVRDETSLIEVDGGLRPHRADGPYASNEEYLGTKYDLLREDALRPLREAVQEVRSSPYKDEAEYENNNIGIYDPVYITSMIFSFRGLATRVAFSLSRVKKHIRWEQSKRLITGSLVALSPADDAFQTTCILATIAARPLTVVQQNPPEIDLFFQPEDQEIDPMKKYIMVESRTSFFEASRHTLLALQHLMREPFPMSEHLVNVQKDVPPPAYVEYNPQMSLSSLVPETESASFANVNVLEDWPSSSALSLDKSQSKALRRILTSKLAIVQGPPGTGKTHVSIVAIKVQLDNLRKDDAPIIITAQTNHALDQILRHIMDFNTNIIRLGGRSKDVEVKKRTLYQVRLTEPPRKQLGAQKSRAITTIRKLTVECQKLLLPLEANKLPLDHRVLLNLGLITAKQAESLVLDSQCTMGVSPADSPGILMEQWLGKCLVPCHRPIQPDDYGWGFEEEDLEVEQLQELEAEATAQDDEDFETLRGPIMLLSDNYTGKGASNLTRQEIMKLLQTTTDLTTIPPQDRGAIYNHFKREMKKLILMEVRRVAKEYSRAVLQRKVGVWEEDSRLLRNARIVGCTTTGLSKYRALISSLRPRTILVEEAAETMEAPVTAACLPSLEHLILVGDHLQLRPHTQVHAFEDEPYYLNLSLFERLVQNGVAYSTLTRQRRMIPEIRRLLTPIYEDVLKDHESVKDSANRLPVEGMGGINSFFFCHEWPEARDANMSCYNDKEARMIIGFIDYLILNGVDAPKITLLTFYNGQRKCLFRKIRNHHNLQTYSGIQVVTVDGYQGEENDIVILSLVRSNTYHAIGFLSSENRACVALSRAKRGFYIFGNAELMACESGVWGSVVQIMFGKSKVKVDKRRVGYQFPLECANHGRKVWIEDPADWDCIHGGCDLPCEGKLPCLHKCPYRCHPYPHDRVNCMQKCNRVLPCTHTCTAICSDACKCDTCSRRSNGMKSILKPAVNGTRPLDHPELPTPRRELSSVSTVAIRGRGSPSSEQWEAYANGGAAADDVRVYRQRKDEEARYHEAIRIAASIARSSSASTNLIDVSMQKADSEQTSLLIDLDEDADPTSTDRSISIETTSRNDKGAVKMVDNLLD